MADTEFEAFLRFRITELRLKKDVSEHKMSLDLDKSGSYIRGITNGAILPSLKELFRIIAYFDITPSEFFSPLERKKSPYHILCEKLSKLNDDQLQKVSTFIDWICP